MEHFIYSSIIFIISFFLFYKHKQSISLGSELLDVMREYEVFKQEEEVKREVLLQEEEFKYKELLSKKKQSEIRVGQISEHFAPLLEEFKYDRKQARFLASPIDFIIFEEEEVIFMEVKTGKSQLNANQRRIKKQIEDKKVRWEVLRIQ
jgi:predicted Holliday junction resolvase-like endonuclease